MRNTIDLGDSRDLSPHIEEKMGQKINCIVTDPPFGKDFVSNFATTKAGRDKNRKIASDDNIEAAIDCFDEAFSPCVDQMAENCDIYVFTSWDCYGPWKEYFETTDAPYLDDIHINNLLIWEKGYPGLGDLVYNWGCGYEMIIYLKKGKRPVNWRRSGVLHFPEPQDAVDEYIQSVENYLEKLKEFKQVGFTQQNEIISIDKIPAGKNIHPTEKPVELMAELIKMSTAKGDLVVDLFSGSGATSVAAQLHGRNSYAIEIDPSHHENSIRRLHQPGFSF